MSSAVIIVGGYNSVWPAYLRMARDLEDLTGIPSVGVPLMPWDWWQSARMGCATRILSKLSRTVSWSRRRLGAGKVFIVGHSAGGLIARLYLSPEPVWGETYGGVFHTAGIVTLGSPHCPARAPRDSKQEDGSWYLVDAANRMVPGAALSDRVRYLAVAGRYIRGQVGGSRRERRTRQMYELFGAGGQEVWGDGLVPVSCAHLDGAATVVLQGVAHSARFSRNWYGGSKRVMSRWCPAWMRHGS